MQIKILAVGDVVSPLGVDYLGARLRKLQKAHDISFTVVNGENANMLGISPRAAEAIFDAGADVITLGNHAFHQKSILSYLDDTPNILRPHNFAPQTPGYGWARVERDFGSVLVINLIGRCDMDFAPDNPFPMIDKLLARETADLILVDFHAEASSEKLAMAYHLDGRVTALWGTHTHVQTSDAMVLARGTGYVTDLGMTGPAHSVLGVKPAQSISMFFGNPRERFEPANGAQKLEAAIFTVDLTTGRSIHTEVLRIYD